MTATDIADKVNKVSNRTIAIVLVMAITCSASAVGTYYGVTSSIDKLRVEMGYFKRDQALTDSLQNRDILQIKLARK